MRQVGRMAATVAAKGGWFFGQRALSSGAQRPVYVAGQGMGPITRKKGGTVREMGRSAIAAAVSDADVDPGAVSALYVGNMLSGILSDQQHVGPLLSTAAGLSGVEASTVEACCGSGGAALRWGYMAVASGMHDTVIVAGVEQMTHQDGAAVTKGLATASDWEKEGALGATFVSLNGALMSMYKEKYGVEHDSFGAFPMNAHNNASSSAHATLRKRLGAMDYSNSPVLTDPVRLLDACPTCGVCVCVHAHECVCVCVCLCVFHSLTYLNAEQKS